MGSRSVRLSAVRTLLRLLIERDFRGLGRRIAIRIYAPIRRFSLSRTGPLDPVKDNTREAFESFWTARWHINLMYLTEYRMRFFDFLAARICSTIVGTGGRICDVGCGPGHLFQALVGRLESADELALVGVDFSHSALIAGAKALPEARFIQGDAYSVPLASSGFDLVLCIETLEHLERPKDAIRELMRLCRTGGRVLITVPDADDWEGHRHHWTRDEFAQLISGLGQHTNVQSTEAPGGMRVLLSEIVV